MKYGGYCRKYHKLWKKFINYDDMTVNETSQSRKKVKKVLSKDDLNEVRTSLVSFGFVPSHNPLLGHFSKWRTA